MRYQTGVRYEDHTLPVGRHGDHTPRYARHGDYTQPGRYGDQNRPAVRVDRETDSKSCSLAVGEDSERASWLAVSWSLSSPSSAETKTRGSGLVRGGGRRMQVCESRDGVRVVGGDIEGRWWLR